VNFAVRHQATVLMAFHFPFANHHLSLPMACRTSNHKQQI